MNESDCMKRKYSILEIPMTLFIKKLALLQEEWRRAGKAEKDRKEERQERLKFEGKYTSQMYKVVLKNFIKNWKDYILMLISSIVVFVCLAVGYGVQQILNVGYEKQGPGIFNSLGAIMTKAYFPIGLLCVFVMIHLIVYDLKCRAKNYGIFLALGMRRKNLYQYIVIEYLSIVIVSFVVGGICGSVILYYIVLNWGIMEGVKLGVFSMIFSPCLAALGTLTVIMIVSLMISYDILGDFKVGESVDQRLVGERLPNKFRKVLICIGLVLIAYAAFQYGRRINYENIYLLIALFIGIFIVLRYAIADILIQEKKQRNKIQKVLPHNQLFHKSRTSSVYMGVMLIVLFGVFYYFSYQLVSTKFSNTETNLFPYDAVCLADDTDNALFEKLVQEYEVEILEVPALRVSAYDSTKGNAEIQGQHIGIAESTYHKLKSEVDKTYEKKPLGLKSDEDIYIVYQQDKSIEAHPIGYFTPKSKPLLHIGIPCSGVDVYSKQEGYYEHYNVKGEEIGSLVGAFSRGERENIIVFSDEYFEKAKDFWKDCNVISGIKIEEPQMAIPGVTTFQGITKLVLLQIPERNMSIVEELLNDFSQKHLEEERLLFDNYPGPLKGIYDSAVSYCYLKKQEEGNLVREHIMTITVDTIVIVIMSLMAVLFILVKMLTEFDANRKRAQFLCCMGMERKERIKLVKLESYLYFYLLPLLGAVVLSVIYTVMIWNARMYTKADIQFFMLELLPLWTISIVGISLIIMVIVNIYAYKAEKVNV